LIIEVWFFIMKRVYFFLILLTVRTCWGMEETKKNKQHRNSFYTNCEEKYNPQKNPLEQLIDAALISINLDFSIQQTAGGHSATFCRLKYSQDNNGLMLNPESILFDFERAMDVWPKNTEEIQNTIRQAEEIPFKAYNFAQTGPRGKCKQVNIKKLFTGQGYYFIYYPTLVDAGKYGQMVCTYYEPNNGTSEPARRIMCTTIKKFKSICLNFVENKNDLLSKTKILQKLIDNFSPQRVCSLVELSFISLNQWLTTETDPKKLQYTQDQILSLSRERKVARLLPEKKFRRPTFKSSRALQFGSFDYLTQKKFDLSYTYFPTNQTGSALLLNDHMLGRLDGMEKYVQDVIKNNHLNASKITHLDLSNNNLYEINGIASGSLNCLKKLNLQNNHISRIPEQIFTNLNRLKILNASENNLSKISEKLNEGKSNRLKILDLNKNNISEITKKTFAMCHFLRVLNLSHNTIKTVDKAGFIGLDRIEKIILSHNKIETFDTTQLKYLPYLWSIELEGNPMTVDEKHRIEAVVNSLPLQGKAFSRVDKKERKKHLRRWQKKSWYANRLKI
jgi:Leucine-rich repeat (LRR) protein